MNSKRSMWKVLLGVVGMGLLVTNCTIKTTDDDDVACTAGTKKKGCICSGDNSVSYQLCNADDGTWDACYCTGASAGGASSSGGSSSSAGTSSSSAGKGGASTTGGSSSSAAGEAGEAGAAGAAGAGPTVDPTDCYGCLNTLCQLEWDQCVLEDENHPETAGNYCLSSTGDDSGQIEGVLKCIDAERKKGLVKRDVVRACGSSLGLSTDPSFFQWPPTDMTAVTAQVLNCMADSPTELNPGTWANSSNIPTNGSSPKPWLDNTCAKLSCTSAL